ncbi:MAG: DUF1822 family protein [Microcoleaceae cyanobacterium MO_207.B10]|nr:DUF1822 family protein [Microcoleaceae cyanobacterium MO_207.B10]
MTMTFAEALTVPLSGEAHRYAEQFAAEQETVEKGKQVYLNTLAVVAVQTYLKWLDIKTAIQKSDCWQNGLRAIFNVADLVLANIGKLECRPILPGEEELFLPPEVTENRVGYLAVKFEEDLNQAQLLGFISGRNIKGFQESIPLTQIESLDKLIDEINWLRKRVNLSQWFEGIFQSEWQPLELLPANNVRSSRSLRLESDRANISCGKIISWDSEASKQITVLEVKVMAKSEVEEEEIDIFLRVYSGNEIIHLPVGLKVQILDESGNYCMEAEAREADDWIQLEFGCQPHEEFTVEMSLGEQIVRENFVV